MFVLIRWSTLRFIPSLPSTESGAVSGLVAGESDGDERRLELREVASVLHR